MRRTLSTGRTCRSCVSGHHRRRAAARTCPTSGGPLTTSWRRCAWRHRRRRRHTVVIRSTVPPGTVENVVTPALTDGLAGTQIAIGAAMCPEFLREGTGIADFFASPFTCRRDLRSWRRPGGHRCCLASLTSRAVVDVRTAEALKYACNAFHATKVSFTNEVGRLFRLLDVDSREVMALFCEDRSLNVSAAYLRPGFAFGGSCLPKDLRSLLHLARMNGADLPLLAGTLATNELVINEAVDRVSRVRRPHHRAARLEFQDRHRRPSREPIRGTG